MYLISVKVFVLKFKHFFSFFLNLDGDKDNYASGSFDRVVGSVARGDLSKSATNLDAKSSDKNQKGKNENFTADEILLDDTLKEEIGQFVKLETIKEKKNVTLKRTVSMDDLDTLRTTFLSENLEGEKH
jgi:hypothetical protein